MALKKDLRILVVDDVSTTRKTMRNLLKQVGFNNVEEAPDGLKALKIIENDTIELVLADWKMPGMTGIELLKAVRSRPETKSLPFIMVSAEQMPQEIAEAIRSGVNGYLIKPFEPEKLFERIAGIFK